jgi:hypothetical protein
MLHSECEAVDHVVLPAGGQDERTCRRGVDEVWLVLAGAVIVTEPDAPARLLGRGVLLLRPRDHDTGIGAGPDGAELLVLSVLPRALTAKLPPRVPEIRHD